MADLAKRRLRTGPHHLRKRSGILDCRLRSPDRAEPAGVAGAKMKRSILQRLRRGFLLVEVMLAVAIFAVAVLALAKSVEAMLNAQIIKDEDEKVRRFMESKMMEIEAGAVPLQDSTTEE